MNSIFWRTSKLSALKVSGTYSLLDPNNQSVTLLTLERAASVLGKKLKVEFA